MSPTEAMQIALNEARRGAGFVSPNPLVGCVILSRDGRLLAKGYHAKLGDLHAETHALKQVSDPRELEGAHLYVTLEPCAHEGRQPSCAKALAKLPLASVTYGLLDPNPKVAGQGAKILSDAGIRVEKFTDLQDELEDLAEIFLVNMRAKRPFVAVKVASSLDGQVALASGESQWITGEESRARVQTLRGEYDAVLTGLGTFLKDDPRLNSRDARFASKRQRAVLLDPQGEAAAKLASSALLKVRAAEDLIYVTKPGAFVSAPQSVRRLELPIGADGNFAIDELLAAIKAEDIHSLFVEAGAQTVSHFFQAAKVDRLYTFVAPKLLGKGLAWSSGLQIPSLAQAIGLNRMQVERLGPDLLLSARPHFV